MTGDDPFSFLGSEPPESKSIKKPHWRDKLFSKTKSNKHTTDQQVEDFLGPSRPSKDLPPTIATSRGIPSPNLDLSDRRYPSSSQDGSGSFASSASNPPAMPDSYPPVSRSRTKKPRKKGLKVSFTSQVPELIGEGGDEAETPPIEVSQSRTRCRDANPPGDFPLPPGHAQPPQLRVETSFDDKSSKKHGGPGDWPLLMANPQEDELLMSLGEERGSRLSFRGPPESTSFAQKVRATMQAEEGRALQNGYEDPQSPQSPEETHSPIATPLSPDSVYETPPVSEIDRLPPPNALRPLPSPSSRGSANISPVNPAASTHLTPKSSTSRLAPHSVSPGSAERPSNRDSRSASRSPQPKFSLRTVANQIGDTAFTDYKAYVALHVGAIQISAENVKPMEETTLSEWMRAAIWWFLRGKTRLEAYARSRPPSGAGARQALIDIGKALWINEYVVPQHQELTRYGSMGVDALIAVVSTTGDKQMADLLGLHQAVMNHIRSLSMSIKRNNILAAAEKAETDPLDTGVWIQYPFFAPDVSAVLSGAATRSMLIEKVGKGPTITHMMPLSDTNRYFTYGSMFVKVCVSSSEDDSQQVAMPCVLSIIRERADWYVYAAINSQNDLVNVMIQSDRKQGPTWDDVDWRVRSHSMRVRLPRGFELDVMFQEDDFKVIWNIVKYTIKAEASLQPEGGESVAFETTLKLFHYMDPGTPKAFPNEPLERCRIRLFERSINVTEGTGTRSVHQGFRFTVLTSPKVKTLSNVRHILGHGSPIVFGLLRGEDGAPALVLKVEEDGRVRSMLMTFYEVSERTTMHSLLLGMVPMKRETQTRDLSLKSYAIEQPDGNRQITHLQFPPGSVSVIDQEHDYVEHGYGPTILSEHLRAFVATEWGSVTDRINLGTSSPLCECSVLTTRSWRA